MSPKELYSVRFILISNKYISNIIYIIFQILYFHFTSLLWYNFFVFSLCFWTSFLYIVEKYCILILRLFCDVIYYYYFHYYYYFCYFIIIFYYYILLLYFLLLYFHYFHYSYYHYYFHYYFHVFTKFFYIEVFQNILDAFFLHF